MTFLLFSLIRIYQNEDKCVFVAAAKSTHLSHAHTHTHIYILAALMSHEQHTLDCMCGCWCSRCNRTLFSSEPYGFVYVCVCFRVPWHMGLYPSHSVCGSLKPHLLVWACLPWPVQSSLSLRWLHMTHLQPALHSQLANSAECNIAKLENTEGG